MADKKLEATRDAYGRVLCELGKTYPNLIVLDSDLSVSTKTCMFAKQFPGRFFNAGVAEQDMVSTAAGFATTGKIVFASTFAVFATGRAWEQVRVSVAYPRLNVKIVATHGGITTGEDGATHQATEDIAIMRAIPNMTVIVPCDALEAEKAIRAVAAVHGPVYVRLSRGKTPVVNKSDYQFKVGKGITLADGKDLTIIAAGIMVDMALDARAELEKEGISSRVINLHTIKPIDKELIAAAARETGAILTAEEHSIIGGLGGAVCEVVAENCPVPVTRLGMKDMFGESGKPDDLLEKYGLTSKEISKAARSLLARKK